MLQRLTMPHDGIGRLDVLSKPFFELWSASPSPRFPTLAAGFWVSRACETYAR